MDHGYNLAAGVGWAPWSRITLSGTLERTHLSSRVSSDFRGGSTAFRGGTLTLGRGGTARLAVRREIASTPYVLGGYAAGVSQPTVNQTFTGRVTNDVRAVFGGAGIQVPLRPGLSLFADGRMMIGDEANELVAVAPLRIGDAVVVLTTP